MMTTTAQSQFLFSRIAASIICGAAPKNFIPSAPFFALSLTHSIASSGVLSGCLAPCPNAVYAKILAL
jgi:hypothetical protein